MYVLPPPLYVCDSLFLLPLVFLPSLCVHPLPPRQRRRLRRRRNRRSVPQPQRDPRTRSQPSCSPTRICLLHMLLLYVFMLISHTYSNVLYGGKFLWDKRGFQPLCRFTRAGNEMIWIKLEDRSPTELLYYA